MSLMDYRAKARSKSAGRKEQEAYEDALRFSKFFYFLCAPVLVFRTEYPRSKKFRLGYFVQKAAQTLFHLVLQRRKCR